MEKTTQQTKDAARLAELVEEQARAYPNLSAEAVLWSAKRRQMWENVGRRHEP